MPPTSRFTNRDKFVMSMETRKYDLPDHVLIDADATSNGWMVWQPESSLIVLGQSNQAETAVHMELAEAEGIPVYKRNTGGQTVILTPRTIVISVRLISDKLDNPQVYFKRINRAIIEAITGLGLSDLHEKGISDIAIGDKKILGSSIYRKRSLVFYHAVLNISETPEFIGRYLKHPVREPDYRIGRRHEDFVTSLHAEGYLLTPEQVRQALSEKLSEKI